MSATLTAATALYHRPGGDRIVFQLVFNLIIKQRARTSFDTSNYPGNNVENRAVDQRQALAMKPLLWGALDSQRLEEVLDKGNDALLQPPGVLDDQEHHTGWDKDGTHDRRLLRVCDMKLKGRMTTELK
jgi:hypothetical protein